MTQTGLLEAFFFYFHPVRQQVHTETVCNHEGPWSTLLISHSRYVYKAKAQTWPQSLLVIPSRETGKNQKWHNNHSSTCSKRGNPSCYYSSKQAWLFRTVLKKKKTWTRQERNLPPYSAHMFYSSGKTAGGKRAQDLGELWLRPLRIGLVRRSQRTWTIQVPSVCVFFPLYLFLCLAV